MSWKNMVLFLVMIGDLTVACFTFYIYVLKLKNCILSLTYPSHILLCQLDLFIICILVTYF